MLLVLGIGLVALAVSVYLIYRDIDDIKYHIENDIHVCASEYITSLINCQIVIIPARAAITIPMNFIAFVILPRRCLRYIAFVPPLSKYNGV